MPKNATKILPLITDHKGVLIQLPLPNFLEKQHTRMVWKLTKANWKDLKTELKAFDWTKHSLGSAEDALNYFLEVLWTLLCKYIPRRETKDIKSTHPWLDEQCKNALYQKMLAEGTTAYQTVAVNCTKILNKARAEYITKKNEKLATLPPHSKRWWRINRELMHKKGQMTSIPTLKDGTEWLAGAAEKANVFARTFDAKCKLPLEIVDTPYFGHPELE
jgi:hypothetical protein